MGCGASKESDYLICKLYDLGDLGVGTITTDFKRTLLASMDSEMFKKLNIMTQIMYQKNGKLYNVSCETDILDDDIIRYSIHTTLCIVRCAFRFMDIGLDESINKIQREYLNKTTNNQLKKLITDIVNKCMGLPSVYVYEILHQKGLRKKIKKHIGELTHMECASAKKNITDNVLWTHLTKSTAQNYLEILERVNNASGIDKR